MVERPSDILAMSDEDFLNKPPAIPEGEQETTQTTAETTETTQETGTTEQTQEVTTSEGQTNPLEAEATGTQEPAQPVTGSDQGAEGDKGSAGATTDTASKETEKPEGEKKPEEKPDASSDEALKHKQFYMKIMTPFKANGRMIELRSPEEAIQLMQMGANYTRKMQELVPHRKALTMLEKHGLLDENKLSFLIDIEKKNPEAIKKLLKDANLDPLEIDTSKEPSYQAGAHQVSDEEVNFNNTMRDLQGLPNGMETLTTITKTWDAPSKEFLWKSPDLMMVIHEQRESGVYDRIVAEMDRQRTIGAIPANVPFLQAYKDVGDKLVEQNAFADLAPGGTGTGAATGNSPGNPASSAVAPLATRVAAPKPAVTNNAQAAAAGINRVSTTKPAVTAINPLEMADEEFLATWNKRV